MSGVKIGITDHAPPPFKVEREALSPHVEFVFLNSWNEKDFDPQILRSLNTLLVWRAGIRENTVRFLERCKIVVRYGVGYDESLVTKTI